jgi:hypothetical protein
LAAGATTIIGTNANSASLPQSDYWLLLQGNSPSGGTVQQFNPPLFHWLYNEDPANAATLDIRYFEFELSTNSAATFSSLYWDITCSNNFYSLLPPITNASGAPWLGTNYWRPPTTGTS